MATPNSSLQPQQQAARLTGKQTAKHYQISTQTLWRWTKLPDFPQPLRRGHIVRYDIAAIDRWLAGEV